MALKYLEHAERMHLSNRVVKFGSLGKYRSANLNLDLKVSDELSYEFL